MERVGSFDPAVQEFTVLSRRVFIPLAVWASLLVAFALPAEAASTRVQKKTVSGPNGRSGNVVRYADRTAGHISNTVTIEANDTDGSGGRCTETWVDYSTKPHLHFNPGLLVNCSGGKRKVSSVLDNDKVNVKGMGVVVCEVPNTSSSITRNSQNCRGNLSAIYLHSGEKYDHFRVNASQFPSGVQIWRI
jgi:hypothetical protein